jgi:hypothetical protein
MADSNDSYILKALREVIEWLGMKIAPEELRDKIWKEIPYMPICPDSTQPLPDLGAEECPVQYLIGLGGVSGSGKTTAGQYLEKRSGYKTIAFADSLKDIVAYLYGLDRKVLEGDAPVRAERKKPLQQCPSRSMVDILQAMGTEVFRSFDPDVWINHVRRKINTDRVVITDMRYVNEIEFVKSLGGYAFEIVRPGHKSEAPVHASEVSIPRENYHHIIVNDEDIEYFHHYINNALRAYNLPLHTGTVETRDGVSLYVYGTNATQ